MGFPYRQILMCAYKITPMHCWTYKMHPIYYIAPYTEFLIATKVNHCYGAMPNPLHSPPKPEHGCSAMFGLKMYKHGFGVVPWAAIV